MDLYFIVNPNSGKGNGQKVWNMAKRILEEEKLPYQAFLTSKMGEAILKAAEITQGRTEELHVLVIGGDGTFNEVINGLDLKTPVRIGFIPSGSGNDLGRSLGFTSDTSALVRKLLNNAETKEMDYGVVTAGDGAVTRRFLVSCGVGFDAAVCDSLNHSVLKTLCNKLGIPKAAYTALGLVEYLKAVPTGIRLELDNERNVEFNSVFFISIHNHPYEGGGYKFAPDAGWNDGILDVTAVNTPNKLKIAPVILNGKKGLKENGFIRFFTCCEAKLSLERPLILHADGEILGQQTGLSVRCVHSGLKVLV